MRQELEKSSVEIHKPLEKDLIDIFKGVTTEIPEFMRFFWEEQQKYLRASSSSQVRYHPQIIKYCLAIHAKSPGAYRDLRLDNKSGTGVMVLPSERTLRDYKNYIRPMRGFNPAVAKELAAKTAHFSEAEKFIAILFDEMKVQEDLVWEKHTGELIGFVDLGDVNVNYGTFKNVEDLATHVLVFLIKSIVNPLSYSFATFATTSVSSFQLFPLFWRAVAILEKTCKLKVVAATADGASPNRKFVRMHKVRKLFSSVF